MSLSAEIGAPSSVNGCQLTFALPPVVTIENVLSLHAEMQAILLEDVSTVCLDASNVREATTPAVQLLVSFEKALLKYDKKLGVIHSSKAMNAAFEEIGMGDWIKSLTHQSA
jgi:hypothetical protein